MISFDYILKKDIKQHNLNWREIPDYSHKILLIRGFLKKCIN